MSTGCDCVCHKLGYVSCGGGCPDHPAWKAAEDPYHDPEGRALVQAIHDRKNNP